MLIDYGSNINKFDSEEVTQLLGILFPCFGRNTHNLICNGMIC